MSSLTIRPLIKEGESLSSYLMRTCQANKIDYLDLINYVQPKKTADFLYKRSFRIDVLPQQKHDIKSLAELLGQTEKKILGMTFNSLRVNLSCSEFYTDNSFLSLMPLLMEIKLRKFCSHCLKENSGFQKLWQIKGIEYCIKHKVKLRNSCSVCNQEQPYIQNNLGEYRCLYCEDYLFSNDQESPELIELGDDQLKIYENWKYLLKPESQILPRIINGLSLEQTVCLTVIFALQSQIEESPTQFRSNLVSKLLRSEYLYRMLRSFNEKGPSQKITLPHLLKILKRTGISLEHFINIQVPDSYIMSIKYRDKERASRRCLTPWCTTYKKADAIMQIPFNNYSYYNKERYSKASICTNCSIRFGYKASTKEWSEIGGIIDLVDKVIYLIWFGKNEDEIKLTLNISDTDYYTAIGYGYKYDLLPKAIKKMYGTSINSKDDIKLCFIKLFSDSGKILEKAQNWFGWNPIQFYYHFYDPEVQYYRWIEFTSKKKFMTKQTGKKIEPQIENVLNNILYSNENITSKEIAASIDMDFQNFRRFGFYKKAQKMKRKIEKSANENDLLNKVKFYVEMMEKENLPVKCKEVYEYIGKRSNTVKIVMPMLAKFISEQSILSKEKLKICKMENLMEQAENIILTEYYENNRIPLLKEIELKLRIGRKIHTRYRPVLEHINQTISNLGMKL